MANSAQKESEVELFTLLKTANLLDYFNSFIEQGGDDAQQLCDASEEEFKEIITLVGMATKPLHVRRLQKALFEWKAKRGNLEKASHTSWIEKWSPAQGGSSGSPSTTPRTPIASSLFAAATPDSASRKRRRSSCGSSGGKSVNSIKRMVELKLPPMEVIIDWEKLDPERQQLIRDHSRIYGRDEKKRKTSELNSHEQMINEAAAQLCLRDPTLLVRRDELFTMARRVVRDSGFTYVHGHSRSKFASESEDEAAAGITMTGKAGKPVLAQVNKLKRQERLEEIDELLRENKAQQDELSRKLEDARSLNSSEEVGGLQVELGKMQNEQVSLQLEQKELKKKQRRSERYYSNKTSKESSLGLHKVTGTGDEGSEPSIDENTPDDGELSGAAAENPDEEAMTLIDESGMEASGETEEAPQPPSITLHPTPAVVTEILPPASGTSGIPLPQRGETMQEEEPVARALYSTFIPQHLHGDENQQAEGALALASYASALAASSRAQVHHTFTGANATSDPTINALLSLAAKDKTVIQGVPLHGMPGLTLHMPTTTTQGGTATTLPGITVVMPSHMAPAGNVQWS